MSLSMYQAAIPVFVRALTQLRHVLQQGEAHAKARNVADATLLQTRLIPDMLPLVKQVQTATDMAKNAAARLAGVELLKFEDNEATFAELYARIDRTLDYLGTFKPAQIDGSEARDITLPTRNGETHFKGQDYLLHFVIPNVYFHSVTAYNILREMGVGIGKSDFLGKN